MLVQPNADLAQSGCLHVSVDVMHLLVVAALRLVDGEVEDDDERAAGREDVVGGVLGIGQGDCVVDDLDRLGGDLPDRSCELGERDGVAVKDVRRAQ